MPGPTASQPFGEADGKITLWSLIRGGFSALITEFGIIVGYIVLPFSLAIFAACYVFWGCILYVVGPLVLATMPSSTLGTISLALDRESVCLELLAVLGNTLWSLMTAIHLNNPQVGPKQGRPLGFLQRAGGKPAAKSSKHNLRAPHCNDTHDSAPNSSWRVQPRWRCHRLGTSRCVEGARGRCGSCNRRSSRAWQAQPQVAVRLLPPAVHREHWPEEARSLPQAVRLWLAGAVSSPV